MSSMMFKQPPRQLALMFDDEPAPVATVVSMGTIEIDMATAAAAVGAFRAGASRDAIVRQYGIEQEQLAAMLTTGMAADMATETRVLARLDWLGIAPKAASDSQTSAARET